MEINFNRFHSTTYLSTKSLNLWAYWGGGTQDTLESTNVVLIWYSIFFRVLHLKLSYTYILSRYR